MTDLVRDEVVRVRAWYNLVADRFLDRYEGESGWYLARCEEDVLHHVCPIDGRSVLDLGTGGGRLLPGLASRAARVVGVDVSEALLARAPRPAGAHLAQMNALDLGFHAASFDVVVALGLFEYVGDLERFLAEIARVLRPGGHLAFTYHQIAAYRRPRPEPPQAEYFGRTIAERSRFWTKRRHQRGDIRTALARSGFLDARHYRLFFRLPHRLHGAAGALDGRPGARALRRAVLVLEQTLAYRLRPLTQFTTGNVLAVARRIGAAQNGEGSRWR